MFVECDTLKNHLRCRVTAISSRPPHAGKPFLHVSRPLSTWNPYAGTFGALRTEGCSLRNVVCTSRAIYG